MRITKKFLIGFHIFFAFLIIGTISPANCFAVEDAILAVINDEIITLKDLKDYLHSTHVSLLTQGVNQKKIEEVMLEMEINGLQQLIEDKLLLSRANKIGLEVRDKLIEDQFKDIKSRYKSEEEFQQSMTKNGITIGELKNKIREQQKIRFVIDDEVRSKIFVTPQEVTEFYDKNLGKFKKSAKFNVASILILYGEDKMAAKQEADEASAKIKAGEDFDKVQKIYSDAPSIGLMEKGQLLAEIETAIAGMQPNQVSEPIAVDLGIYIFKLLEKIPENQAPLSEVKTHINSMLMEQRFQERLQEWVKKLKDEAYIEIKK